MAKIQRICVEDSEIHQPNIYARFSVGPCDWDDLTDGQKQAVLGLGIKEPLAFDLEPYLAAGWTEFPDGGWMAPGDLADHPSKGYEVVFRDGTDGIEPRWWARDDDRGEASDVMAWQVTT